MPPSAPPGMRAWQQHLIERHRNDANKLERHVSIAMVSAYGVQYFASHPFVSQGNIVRKRQPISRLK